MSKFHAVPTVVDGIRFMSKGEAARYVELKALERAGRIVGLELQPSFDLHVLGGVKLARYVADFRYVEGRGEVVVEDFKGVITPLYRLKRKWMQVEYGIVIRETTAPRRVRRRKVGRR